MKPFTSNITSRRTTPTLAPALCGCLAIGVLHVSLLTPVASAQAGDSIGVRIGDPAPEIVVDQWLSAPASAPRSLAGMRGKWVILEFWAMWCPGCVLGVPHMNELAAGLDSGRVRVVTLSSDPIAPLKEFFRVNRTDTWLAHDSLGSSAARYRVGGYPQAVIIDPQGMVHAFVDPRDLTVAELERIMQGQPLTIAQQYNVLGGSPPVLNWDEQTPVDESSSDIISQAVIRRSPADRQFFRHLLTPGKILGDGVPLDQLVSHAWGVTQYQVERRIAPSVERYRVSVVAPVDSDSAARHLLRESIQRTFNLDITVQSKPREVIELRWQPQESVAGLRPFGGEDGDGFASKTGIHVKNVTMRWIVDQLSELVWELPVIDLTGLTGRYDVDVDWGSPSETNVTRALQRIGLVAQRVVTDVPIVVVDHAKG